jgi:hypothetical protein
MDKCEGCPIVFGTELVEIKGYGHCGRSLKGGAYPCHLTADHQRFISAMLRGVFDCGHCWHGTVEGKNKTVYCVLAGDGNHIPIGCFCDRWQERKGEEDG